MNTLFLNSVCCGYKNSFVLNNISFGVPKGAITGIIGPNGAGKTTLFKGISGEIKLLSGSIEIKNYDVNELSVKERAKKIAVVSQFTDIDDITVEEYVLMGRTPYRNRWHFFETKNDFVVAEKYMKLTGIYEIRNKSMFSLSGGEQQLVSITRALTQEPELLLLDEPTSHLDITHQVQILNLIQNLTSELGLTVLMIIHDLNLAGEYCDYLVLLKNGQIHCQGVPGKVLTYENIEEVYKTIVVTRENPVSKRPAVFLVSNKVFNLDSIKRN